jgi:serine/threonine protein phosphatase PrpC
MHVPAAVENRWGVQKNEKLVLIPHKNSLLQRLINIIKAIVLVIFTVLTLGIPFYFNRSLIDTLYYDVFYHKKLICLKKDPLGLRDMMNFKKLKASLLALNWVQDTPELQKLIPLKRKEKLKLDDRIRKMLSVFFMCLKQPPSLSIKSDAFSKPLSVIEESGKIHENPFSVSTCIGLKPVMEDIAMASSFRIQTGQIDEIVPSFIIMDGHGIKRGLEPINEFAKKNFLPKLNFYLNAYLQDGFSLQGVYESFKASLNEIHEGYPGEFSGTTFVGIFLINHVVFCVSVGDSKAYLVDPFHRTPIALSADPDHPYFKSRLERLSAKVKQTSSGARVEGVLNMAAALGDKNIVNSAGDPVIFPVMSFVAFPDVWIQSPAKIILGSDGVFDFITEKQMEEIIHSPTASSLKSKELVNLAISQGSNDNLSCMIIEI